MDSLIIEATKNIIQGLGHDCLLILFILLETLSFILNLILSICLYGYTLKNRAWQLLFSAFLVLVSLAITSVVGFEIFIPCILAGLSVLTFIPIMLIRVKTFKITEKQRDLVKFIDSNILDETPRYKEEFSNKISCENHAEQQDSKVNVSDFEVDFQHVKSVIARLDYFGLKESDKKQVKELENAIKIAEKGEFSQQVKLKINDGLGALLKIMSKYGV